MGQLDIPQEALDNPDEFRLLPATRMEGDQMVAAEYMAEVTSAKQKTDKNGKPMLAVSLSVNNKGNQIYIHELFTYQPAFLPRLKSFITLLGLPTNPVPKEEDFVGRYVWLTVKHDTFKRQDGTDTTDNKVQSFLRAATPDEVNPPAAEGETPF